MNEKRLEWRVGLFVFIGLALLAALLIKFSKGASLLRPTYTLRLNCSNVGGLKPRAQVLLAGVQIGSVSSIALADNGTNVNVMLSVYGTYHIYKDARFVIESSGFLGDQYVSVIPGANIGPVFAENDEVFTEPPFNLQEVARSASGFIKKIDETATRLNDAIADVRAHLLNEHTLTNLAAAVINARILSEKAVVAADDIHAILQTNEGPVSVAVSNLVNFTEQLKEFAGGLTNLVATNAPYVERSLKNIEATTASLNSAISGVQEGKGLAGTVLKNDDLAEHVSLIASNLSVTSSNLNRLGLWGILWQHKPPRTNAPSAVAESLKSPKDRAK